MKATITLEDALFRQAKARATERGISFDALIADALRLELTLTPPAAHPPRPRILRLVPSPVSEPTRLFDDHEVERLLTQRS